MNKNIFEVNNEEKSRILNLHENATKRQYLSEQGTTTEPIDDKTKQHPSNPDYASFFINLTQKDRYGVDKAIENAKNRGLLNIFRKDLKHLKKEVDNTIFDRRGAVDNNIQKELQIELSKNLNVIENLKSLAGKVGINPTYYNIN
jgi:hypothetical protein